MSNNYSRRGACFSCYLILRITSAFLNRKLQEQCLTTPQQ